MNPFLDKIYERLTEDDKKQLSDIYEPKVVTVPDENAWRGLTVMRDGRIRFYGLYDRKHFFDKGEYVCYKESCDGGLSWKKHIVYDKNTLGSSVYVPFMDKYIRSSYERTPNEFTYVMIGDDPDDTNPKKIIIGENIFEPKAVIPLRSRNRLIFVAHERRPECHPTCYYPIVFYSDDCGESWNAVPMEECPYFDNAWPDRGIRWQQNNRENAIVELSDGTLYMVSRTATNYHYESYSYDGGETWTPFEQSVFHSAGTMPQLERLSDGRIVFLWCNTKMMPELEEAVGDWEDVFTNRDVNHCAVSADEGKTWQGYREVFLNPIRCAPDFRSNGGAKENDKSVHQFEMTELPMGKLLVVFGQHEPSRRIVIFDINWLYEHNRRERFDCGFKNVSTQNYVKSILGGFQFNANDPLGNPGHCAYNRTSVAMLVPSPENNRKEDLLLTRSGDERLVSGIGGVVWNFPIHKKGKIIVKAYIPGKGLRASLLDYWMNPSDDTVEYFANYSVVLRGDMQKKGELFSEFVLDFDCDRGTVILTNGDYLKLEKKIDFDCPNGLCYLHLQSAATEPDGVGAYISEMSFEG